MLETITFTGVDDKTDPEWAVDLTRRYPKIEFGILIGTPTGTGQNLRFPSLHTIQRWKARCDTLRLSLHLCGRYTRVVFEERWDVMLYYDLCYGFRRIQVNARRYDWAAIGRFVRAFDQRIILQHRASFGQVPLYHSGVEYLFDVSGGQGKDSLDQWPNPSAWCRCGYAGGVNSGNVEVAVKFVRQWPSLQWIDMESGVRTNDVFDPSKVEQVCELAFPK